MTNTVIRIDGATHVGTNPELAPASETFTSEQLKLVAEDGIKLGRWDRATADKLLAAEGVTPDAPDTRTDIQKEMDAAYPPARPEEFVLPKFVSDTAAYPAMNAADREKDRDVRTWLAGAGFARDHGSQFAKAVFEDEATLANQSAVERELQKRTTLFRLKERWGDDFDANLGAVHDLVRQIEYKRPGFQSWLDRTGSGNSERSILLMFNQATRQNIRNGR